MAILNGVKKKIVVNAGHHNADPGAVTLIERDEVKLIRDEVVPILKSQGFEVVSITDDRTLPQSIADANKAVPTLNDGLCVDIHLNFASNKTRRGTEGYYGESEISRLIADSLAFHVAQKMGIPNGGAKPDTETAVGELGWIRKTYGWATLIEVCFISNAQDMAILKGNGGYKLAAEGIVNGILNAYGMPLLPVIPSKPTLKDALKMIEDGHTLIQKGIDIIKAI